MIGGLSFWTTLFLGWLLLCFVIGFLSQPIAIFLSAPTLPLSIKRIWGKILFVGGQLTQGASVLDKPADAPYELRAAKARYEEGESEILADGEWVPLKGPGKRWTRLGKAPFGITWEKDDAAFRGIAANFDEEEVREVIADGRGAVYADERGGYEHFTPHTGAGERDRWMVMIDRVISRWRRAGAPDLLETAQRKALGKHGGNTAELSNKQLILASLGSITLGVITGYIVMGGF